MGVYSSVWLDCPFCGQSVELKTKAGGRFGDYFASSYIPREIMIDLEMKPATCASCKEVLTARIHYKPELVLEKG